jgi:hypothetical protein
MPLLDPGALQPWPLGTVAKPERVRRELTTPTPSTAAGIYVVIYRTDKGGIAGTSNSHLFFAHMLFQFSHGETQHQSHAIHFNICLICKAETTIFDSSTKG